MGVRRVPRFDQQADPQPGTSGHGFPEALRPSPTSRPRCRCARGVQKNFAASLDEIAERDAAGKPIENWFQHEDRIAQQNKITMRWALLRTQPSAPHDQRARSTYTFTVLCPQRGT